MDKLYRSKVDGFLHLHILDLYKRSFNTVEDNESLQDLFFCVVEHKTWADDLICECLENWDYDRVAIVDKILLRMGVSEIYHMEDIPPKVSISEMVEIAKIYSTEESSSFVNGILDTIYKDFNKKV